MVFPLANNVDGYIVCNKCNSNYMIFNNIPILLKWDQVEKKIKFWIKAAYPDIYDVLNECLKINCGLTLSRILPKQCIAPEDVISNDRFIPKTLETYVKQPFFKNARRKAIDIMSNARQTNSNQAILEIGCEEGSFVKAGVENYSWYFGMDISFSKIQKCYSLHKYKNAIFIVADAEAIPLKSQRISFCILQWLLEHLGEPEKCVGEIFRVLQPQGKVYIDTNYENFMFTYRWFQRKFVVESYRKRIEKSNHPNVGWFSEVQMRSLFVEAGFSKIKVSRCYFLLDMLMSKGMAKMMNYRQKRGNSDIKETEISRVSETVALEFEPKVDFQSVTSPKGKIVRIVNGLTFLSYYFLLTDRLMEFFHQGEGIILFAEKPVRTAE